MTSTQLTKVDLARSSSIEKPSRPRILRPTAHNNSSLSPSKSTHLKPSPQEPDLLLSSRPSQRDRATPERTYLLSTIIQTGSARKETLKSFVDDKFLKNTEIERKVKHTDVRMNRDSGMGELQLQQKTRLSYLETRKNRTGTMFMQEFWAPNFSAKVLRDSGLSKLVRQVRRCRYQTKSTVGDKIEKTFKDRHPDHKEAQENDDVSRLLGNQSARQMASSHSNNFIIHRHASHATIPTPAVKSDPQLKDQEEIQTPTTDTRKPQTASRDPHFQRKGNRSSSTPALKPLNIPIGSSANRSPGQPSLLSLNMIDDEFLGSLNNVETSRPATRLPSSRLQTRQRSHMGDTFHGKLFAKIDEGIHYRTNSTREATEMTKRETLSSFRNLHMKTSRSGSGAWVGRHSDQINDILNNCDRAQEYTPDMLNKVNKMQGLIHLVSQNHQDPEEVLDMEREEDEIQIKNDDKLHIRYLKKTVKRDRFPKYLMRLS